MAGTGNRKNREAGGLASMPAMCGNPNQCAAAFKVLSDANRVKIIRALISGPRSVGRIAEATGLGPHRVSHHLGRMRLAGLVDCDRDGKSIIYRIGDRVAGEAGIDLGCCLIKFREL